MVREIVPQYTKVSAKKLRAAIDAGEDLSDDDAVSDDRDASDEEGGRVGALDDPRTTRMKISTRKTKKTKTKARKSQRRKGNGRIRSWMTLRRKTMTTMRALGGRKRRRRRGVGRDSSTTSPTSPTRTKTRTRTRVRRMNRWMRRSARR
jgi:hypothetical protein